MYLTGNPLDFDCRFPNRDDWLPCSANWAEYGGDHLYLDATYLRVHDEKAFDGALAEVGMSGGEEGELGVGRAQDDQIGRGLAGIDGLRAGVERALATDRSERVRRAKEFSSARFRDEVVDWVAER